MTATRRDFLKASLGTSTMLSLCPGVPTFLLRSAQAAATRRDTGDTILVVLQLAGGNDGLNTVVPYEDDEYARNRPTLRLSGNQVHKIDSQFGFHPNMGAFMRLYQEGLLSILHGVGYPNPSGDHAVAMLDWQTAQPHRSNRQTGWLGRMVDHVARPDDPSTPAVFVGELERPTSLNAERVIVPSVTSLHQCALSVMPGSSSNSAYYRQLARTAEAPRDDNPLLEFVQRSTVRAYADNRQIEEIAQAGVSAGAGDYPQYPAAGRLRTVAQLIRADLGIRIFYTELGGAEPGGFDNHANQLGNHCALLRQLSESVAAFVDDLKRDKLLDRVLLMTFSEFGRTVKENGRRGTGHGSAAPIFLAGGNLKGGMLGEHPNLTDLENGGQKHHTDFRRVYATVLDRWLGFESRAALGEEFEPLDVLRG